MPTQVVSGRIRLGILALPAAAAFYLVANVILSPRLYSAEGVQAYAELVASALYTIVNLLFAVGALLAIFGFVALYACMASGRAERWAFVGLIFCIPGFAATFAGAVGTSGLEAVAAEQYLEGQRAVLEEWYDLLDWTSLFIGIANSGLLTTGLVLFGVAIWRSQTLPKGAAILWFAQVVLLLATPLTWVAAPIAFLLITVAGSWIAWVVWQQPSAWVGEAGPQPRVQ